MPLDIARMPDTRLEAQYASASRLRYTLPVQTKWIVMPVTNLGSHDAKAIWNSGQAILSCDESSRGEVAWIARALSVGSAGRALALRELPQSYSRLRSEQRNELFLQKQPS